MKIDVSKFKTKEDLFEYLSTNKELLIAQKKAEFKKADAISIYIPDEMAKAEGVDKANEPISDIENLNEITVLVAINTTNLMDGHSDVHFPSLWKKSLSENKMIMHLQEHKMAFDSVISEGKDLQAYTKYYLWTELGFPYAGKTQALMFKSKVKRSRNEFMFKQYAAGYVKNHSVGMNYVKLQLAINDEDYAEEFAIWEKYIDKIANKEVAENQGYFWAVTQAKVREGSAVLFGSNYATPTLENNKEEPQKSTPNEIEPTKVTQKDFYLNMNLKN
jgi:hypothetical protein